MEEEAAVIREIAARLLRGESLRGTTSWLINSEVTTVRGGQWRTSTVRQLMTSARLSGQREWTPRVQGRGYGMGQIVADGSWEPILTREQTAELRALFAYPAERGRPAERLLSGGLAVCALCGESLVSARDERQGRRYACVKSPGSRRCGRISVVAEAVEEHVLTEVLAHLEQAPIRDEKSEPKPTSSRTRAELSALERDLVLLARDHGSGRLTRAEWMEARAGLQHRLEALQASSGPAPRSTPELPLAEDVRETWPHMTLDERRSVLSHCLTAVIVLPARRRGHPNFDCARVRLQFSIESPAPL